MFVIAEVIFSFSGGKELSKHQKKELSNPQEKKDSFSYSEHFNSPNSLRSIMLQNLALRPWPVPNTHYTITPLHAHDEMHLPDSLDFASIGEFP
jgi:hypothetical protein